MSPQASSPALPPAQGISSCRRPPAPGPVFQASPGAPPHRSARPLSRPRLPYFSHGHKIYSCPASLPSCFAAQRKYRRGRTQRDRAPCSSPLQRSQNNGIRHKYPLHTGLPSPSRSWRRKDNPPPKAQWYPPAYRRDSSAPSAPRRRRGRLPCRPAIRTAPPEDHKSSPTAYR